MEKLEANRAILTEHQKVIQAEEEQVKEQETQASELNISLTNEMAIVKHELESTLAKIKQLRKEHLVEIKSLGQPPNAVVLTLTGLVILCAGHIKSVGGGDIIP